MKLLFGTFLLAIGAICALVAVPCMLLSIGNLFVSLVFNVDCLMGFILFGMIAFFISPIMLLCFCTAESLMGLRFMKDTSAGLKKLGSGLLEFASTKLRFGKLPSLQVWQLGLIIALGLYIFGFFWRK